MNSIRLRRAGQDHHPGVNTPIVLSLFFTMLLVAGALTPLAHADTQVGYTEIHLSVSGAIAHIYFRSYDASRDYMTATFNGAVATDPRGWAFLTIGTISSDWVISQVTINNGMIYNGGVGYTYVTFAFVAGSYTFSGTVKWVAASGGDVPDGTYTVAAQLTTPSGDQYKSAPIFAK